MSVERFTILYHKYAADTLTAQEWREWKELFANEAYAELFVSLVGETAEGDFHVAPGDIGDPQSVFQAITGSKAEVVGTPGRIRVLHSNWLKYAAIIVLLLSGVVAYWKYTSKALTVTKQRVIVTELPNHNTGEPVLILADGRIIRLDSISNGLLANEGGAAISKTGNGAISYLPGSVPSASVSMNTIKTPKGRQYQVALPDGSKVWLNAFTSIRFPAVFALDKRVVEVQGEAYFEIIPDKTRPFVVNLGKEKSIDVLGTSFNVNNYADEPHYTTTLLSGSIKVNASGNTLVLKNNETVSIAETCQVIPGINAWEQIAWKNGVFNFRGTDTRSLLRQIARWYDIEIQYDTDVPQKVFEGKMGRDLSLTQVRKILNDFGIHNTLNGNKLIIER